MPIVYHWIREFGCPACKQHWEAQPDQENPGHACPQGYPPGGIEIGRRRPDKPELSAPAEQLV